MGGVFEALNDGVNAFGSSVGDRMHQIVEDSFGVFVDHICSFDQRGKLRGPRGLHPLPEELECPGDGSVFPKPAKVLF